MSTSSERWITRRLRLRHLEMVAEVHGSGNILKASQRLNLTQPAVTKAIQDVESTLGLQLFERSSRGLKPTLYGDAFARHAKIILAQVRHAGEEIEDLREGNAGHVRVGTLLAASIDLLPRAIVMLKAKRPKVAITVIDGTNDVFLPSLTVGGLDIVVGRLPETTSPGVLVQEELYSEPTCLAVRADHPLLERGLLKLEDVATQPWVLPLPETILRRQIEQTFSDANVPLPTNVIESISILTNRALLQNSDYVGVLPYHVALADVKQGILRILPVKLVSAGRPVGIITRGDELLPAAAALVECLRVVGAQISIEHRNSVAEE